jgi:hypothetical protein
MSQRGLQRWGPLAGAVFVALIVIGFLISGDSPNPDASNAKIVSYLGDNSQYDKSVAGFFILLAASLFLLVFFAALRSRLVSAEGGLGRLGALAFGAGIISLVFLVIGICLFISPVFAANDAGKNALEPSVYRVTQDLGYLIWVASVVIGALAVWATSAVVLQTGMLPRWYGWFSVVVGVVCLAAIFFIPILVYWLWILITSILLFVRPAPIAPAVAPAG